MQKKIFAIAGFCILLSSCATFFEKIGEAIHHDKDCWIDTRTMMFYYYGRKKMTGIRIRFFTDSTSFRYDVGKNERGIEKIDLSQLKEKLLKQTISIWIDRDSTHWRDDISFLIIPKDWEKRKMISTHT